MHALGTATHRVEGLLDTYVALLPLQLKLKLKSQALTPELERCAVAVLWYVPAGGLVEHVELDCSVTVRVCADMSSIVCLSLSPKL